MFLGGCLKREASRCFLNVRARYLCVVYVLRFIGLHSHCQSVECSINTR